MNIQKSVTKSASKPSDNKKNTPAKDHSRKSFEKFFDGNLDNTYDKHFDNTHGNQLYNNHGNNNFDSAFDNAPDGVFDNTFETFTVTDCKSLKENKIYFFLKEVGISENHIKKLRSHPDSIFKNGVPATTRDLLSDGDILKVKISFDPHNVVSCGGHLEILFEDKDFLIVNKPHNLCCMPSKSHFQDNLCGQICAYLGANVPFHILGRLDRETAGIVVAAKNLLATKQTFEKTYHALCHGKIGRDFVVDAPILTRQENGINVMKREVSSDGKSAVTQVFKIQNFDQFSLVKLKLLTGRTHQIRVHMAYANHPLLGDSVYGIKDGFSHTMLLMKRLEFVHFRTKEKIILQVEYPDDWPLPT